MYIFWALYQVGRSQSIVLESYVYIPGPMSDENVSEYSTTVLCIYSGPYVRWEGLRV